MKLFDRACSFILESQYTQGRYGIGGETVQENFELITLKEFSHIIILDYYVEKYNLYKIYNTTSTHIGKVTVIPDISLVDEYEGSIPPKGFITANITTGRDIMDLHNLTRDDGFIPGSYYIVKYPDRLLKKFKKNNTFDWFKAYLKPAESAFDYTSKDTTDEFGNLMGEL